ncbi:MAG: porin [Pirellulales bacterium]
MRIWPGLLILLVGVFSTEKGLRAEESLEQPWPVTSPWPQADEEATAGFAGGARFAEGPPGSPGGTVIGDRVGGISRHGSAADELAELGKTVESQQEKIGALGSDMDRKIDSGSSGSTMRISGRVHADYWSFPDDSAGVNVFETGDPNITPQDRFAFRRLRFGVQGDVKDLMEYKIEMEFAAANDVEFRDAYLGFSELPVLQTILIGNQKRPYGLDHLNSSNNNVFLERPFVIEGFNQDARRLGVVSYGVSEGQSYNWRYGVYNLRNVQDEGAFVSDHYQLEMAARLANTIWYDETSGGRGYAHWAIAGTAAHPDGSSGSDPARGPGFGRAANEARFFTRPEARSTSRWLDTGRIAAADWYEILALESVVNVGSVQVVGEYQHLWLQRDEIVVSDADLGLWGGYVYASYFLTGEHMPWDRARGTLSGVKPFENFFCVERCRGGSGGGWGAWQVAARWSYADFTDDAVFGGIGEAVTLALNWYWSANARMQLNYINGRITDRLVRVGGRTFTEGDYEIFGARFMIHF